MSEDTLEISEEQTSSDEHMTDEDLKDDHWQAEEVDHRSVGVKLLSLDDGSDVSEGYCKDIQPNEIKNGKIKEEILQRYHERQGKQLYLRFPHKLPETQQALEEKIAELIPLVVKVHKPRQRHVRFCLIDFATKDDRDAALSNLKKTIKTGDLQRYVVEIPRTESLSFVKELAETKIKSIENKKTRQRLKKASKKSLKQNNFTSTVIVLNLPKNATVLQIRNLFTNVVDINIKSGKGKVNKDKSIAAVTFPTTLDARNAMKKKLCLGGNQLTLKFDNKNLKKKSKSNDLKPPSNSIANSHKSELLVKQIKLTPTIHAKIEKVSTNLKKNTKVKSE